MTELREIAAKLFDAVATQLGDTVDLDGDYYWMVEPAEAFDLTRTPEVVTGQLSDDLAELRASLNSKETAD